jgi:DTW domain-containing protein YfiP
MVEEIAAGVVALVYPGATDEAGGDLSGIRQVIIIDGTWHEARKIHQRSPYLQRIRRVSLRSAEKSMYTLRRNQKESGLCSAECVVVVLRRVGQVEDAERLLARFLAFITQSGAKPFLAEAGAPATGMPTKENRHDQQ